MTDKKMGAKEILSGGGEKKKEPKKKSGKARPDETRIKHHKNGSHTVTHIMGKGDGPNPPDSDVSYAVSNLNGVKDGLDEHVGEPSEGGGDGGAMPPPAPTAA